jgi:hypothetical protein
VDSFFPPLVAPEARQRLSRSFLRIDVRGGGGGEEFAPDRRRESGSVPRSRASPAR